MAMCRISALTAAFIRRGMPDRFLLPFPFQETRRCLTMKRDEPEDDSTQPFGRGYLVFLLVMGALLAIVIYLELWV